MGDPKKPRKQYASPRNLWRTDELTSELFLVGTYGLRNKRELWRSKTELSRIRKQARSILAEPQSERITKERNLLEYLKKMSIIDKEARFRG